MKQILLDIFKGVYIYAVLESCYIILKYLNET